MDIIEDLGSLCPLSGTVALSIGTFDGIHLGHQKILCRAADIADTSVVITFSNHPKELLSPTEAPKFLCSLKQKLSLIEQCGIDIVLLFMFSEEFRQQSTKAFLQRIKSHTAFVKLILGDNARFGNGRAGSHNAVKIIGEELGFSVEYVKTMQVDGEDISSKRIRKLVNTGDMVTAKNLLGREYSIRSKVIKGHGKSYITGFPTANMDIAGLCLPPSGVYAATTVIEGVSIPGIVNIGTAPTIKNTSSPELEVHILKNVGNIYGKDLEVIFHTFIRQERCFSSVEMLKKQISIDIASTREKCERNA